GGLLGLPAEAALTRLLSNIFATAASVVPNASVKPALSADESWPISSGWFGFDLTLKRGAPSRLSLRLRYRSRTASCCGVGAASVSCAETSELVHLSISVR